MTDEQKREFIELGIKYVILNGQYDDYVRRCADAGLDP